MARNILIAVIFSASLASLAAMTSPAVPPGLFVVATLCIPPAILGLARLRSPQSWRCTGPAWVLLLLLQGTTSWLLYGPMEAPGTTAGLPAGAWWMLIGFGALPLAILASWFAWDFEPTQRRQR